MPWPEAVKQAFLAQRFHAQHLHYTKHYADADWLVVGRGGIAIGRLYLHRRRDDEHGVIDIALLPERRAQGYGYALMTDVLAEAAAAGKAVRIHVENNPAKGLYARLGFKPVGDHGL